MFKTKSNILFKSVIPGLMAVAVLSLGQARSQAQALVTVDPSAAWIGYMNVFGLPDSGSIYLFGNPYGTADLRAVFGTNSLTLSPCTNVWETLDTSYVQADGKTPAVVMDANFYVQDDNLVNTNVVFVGSCVSNTLTANPEPLTGVYYTSVAFIKTFDDAYNLLNEATSNLVTGQSFSINLDTTGATHVQYGFETMGPDANPTNTTLGDVVVAVAGQSATVTVDPSQAWGGYMSWSELPANGGTYVDGGVWGTAALQAAFTGTNQLTLSPCTNVWETNDTFWVQADGTTPNKIMDANMYVQNDNLANTNLIFIGTCLSNTLTANPEPLTGVSYTSVAFVKTFDASYNLMNSVSSSGLTAGQPFIISLNTAGATHVQYGFETVGPDASPTEAASPGNVVMAAAIPPSPAPTLTNAAPIPTLPQSDVLCMYDSSGVYTNTPVERWLSSWSGAAENTYSIPGTSRTVLKYSSLQYAGVEFYNNDPILGAGGDNMGGSTNFAINTTGYDTFHVDIWTPNANQFGIQLVSINPTQPAQVDFLPASGAITNYGWVSLNIPLSEFAAIDPSTDLADLQQLLWIDNEAGGGYTGGTFYIDNVYFYKSNSVPSPTITTDLSGGNIQLHFPTQMGATYDVLYKTNLTDPVWQTLTNISGSGADLMVPDPVGQQSRFYRLSVH